MDSFRARAAKHELLEGVGEKGIDQLQKSSVLIVGAGGLGSPAALYLAGSGLGRLGLIDEDRVDRGNLNRQILHDDQNVDRAKVSSAKERLSKLNPDLQIDIFDERLREDNIKTHLAGYDFVIDGTDNFTSKFLINDACFFLNKPFSHAGAIKFEGQTMTVLPKQSACVRCLFEEPPPPEVVGNCSEEGVFGPLTGVIGCMQAAEALKVLLGLGDSLAGAILTVDVLKMRFRKVSVPQNPSCRLCGDMPEILEIREEGVTHCKNEIEQRWIFTFTNSETVIKAERALKTSGLEVESRVTPRQLSHECGICLEAHVEDEGEVLHLLKSRKIKVIRHGSLKKFY